MADVSRIDGVESLNKRLEEMEDQFGGKPKESAIVGFTQNYALRVHEDLEAHHNVGQAKYLEQPARELKKDIGGIVQKAVRRGATLLQGMILAGLRLQREAQKLTPVDTGALKASAFTKPE